MRKNLIIICIIFALTFSVEVVVALTNVNVYIDSEGRATFLGNTDQEPLLPEEIILEDGIIYGETSKLTFKNGDEWRVSIYVPEAMLNVVLPSGANIKNISLSEISVDKKLLWVYAYENINISYTIEKEKKQPFFLEMIIGLAIIVIIFLIKFLYKYSKTKKQSLKIKEEIILQVLNEREKSIIFTLKKYGEIKSSYLRKLCGIPKASFSRHLIALEKKKLIRRRGIGKNKNISLVP